MAFRREYAVTWQGNRKAGSEVCFYRGVKGDPFSLFFSSGDVQCLPADAILDFPPGLIHAFARHKDGYASAQRDYTVYDGPPRPEAGYEKLETPLVRAGVVDFLAVVTALPIKQRVGLWIASTPNSVGTFIPLVPGETTILAPAETILVPLLIQHGLPVGAGEPLYLQPLERQAAIFKAHPGSSDVILWTRVDAASFHDAHALLQAPTITLKAGSQTVKPIAPLYGPESQTLLIFRDLPPGEATLSVEGSAWKRVTRVVKVMADALTIEREAVPLVAAGSVVVQWSMVEASASAADECSSARTAYVPLVRAELLHCTTTASGEKECSKIAAKTASFIAEPSATFDGVPAGSYTVIVEPPMGNRQSLDAAVVTGLRTMLHVTFPSFNLFGTVTLNGRPVHARLIFASGQAVTGIDGRYSATLAADPLLNQVRIEPCDEKRTLTFIPRSAPTQNSVYDMDVRLGMLNVQVTDPERRPLADAAVRFSPVKSTHAEGTAVYFSSSEKLTDSNGRASFDDVPDGFPVGVCATHQRFVKKCSPPLDLTALGDTAAILQFDPVGMRGHVEGHTGQGYLATVNPAGRTTEQVQLDVDGTFLFRARHAAPEYLIYVSATRPLVVLPLPLSPVDDLTVQVPVAPSRTFAVTVTNMRAQYGFVGVWIGGMYVPLQVLNTHQELRGLDSMLYRGARLEIRDIAATGPITVAFGVPDPAAKEFADVFTLPQYAGITQHPVTSSVVTLPQ